MMRNDWKIARVGFSLKDAGKLFEEGPGGGPGEMASGTAAESAGGMRGEAPLAMWEPVEHLIHGHRRVDHYAWMKNKKDPRVSAYLEAENAYADAEMKATEGFQEKLYQEVLGRILQTDLSVPYLLKGYEYYTRTVEGKQYPIYCRKRATSDQRSNMRNQEEEVLLDLNEMAVGHTYMGLGIFEVSDNNQWLAYATDTTGFRQYVLEVKDLGSGHLVGRTAVGEQERTASEGGPYTFRVERVTSAAWAADNRSLFYVTEDEVTKRSNQLWRHEFGKEATRTQETTGADELIYEERDERFRMDVERSRSGAYLFLEVNSHTTSEIRYLRADSPFSKFLLVTEREDEHEYYLDHHPGSASDTAGGAFFIRTNSGGRTFRLMTAPTVDPVRSRWREVIANRA